MAWWPPCVNTAASAATPTATSTSGPASRSPSPRAPSRSSRPSLPATRGRSAPSCCSTCCTASSAWRCRSPSSSDADAARLPLPSPTTYPSGECHDDRPPAGRDPSLRAERRRRRSARRLSGPPAAPGVPPRPSQYRRGAGARPGRTGAGGPALRDPDAGGGLRPAQRGPGPRGRPQRLSGARPGPRDAFPDPGDDGPQIVTVLEVRDDSVLIDTNHPLAGRTLRYRLEVLEVRDATRAELAKGHPLPPDTDHTQVEDKKVL